MLLGALKHGAVATYLAIILTGATISCVMAKCTFTTSKKNGHISCTNITPEDYLSSIFDVRANIVNAMPSGTVAKISIDIADSDTPVVDDWLFLPWEDHYFHVQSVAIVNSSVHTVKPLSKLSVVETLNLSKNNISDYRFLNKMKKLRHLHLSHSTFDPDNYLFTYLQKEPTRLNLVNLSYSNLQQFGVITNLIDHYDFSFNPNLTLIHFNHSVGYRSPFLNFSGNNNHIILKHLRGVDSFCVSIDLSGSNKTIDFNLLKTLRISEKILLSNNNISSLDESHFNFSNFLSAKCPSRITVDMSRSNLSYISPNYFSSYILNTLNLSNNNLVTLKGSIFRQSDILHLDFSSCNITSISPSVFNFLIVDTLDLSKNNIWSLDGVFDYVESAKNLDISFNPIQTLDETTFRNCRDLETLNLANVFIKTFSGNTLSNVASLRTLMLSFNDSIDPQSVKNMHVTELILTNTNLEQLKAEQFKGFYKLKRLTFIESSVSKVDSLAFKGLFNLKRINNFKDLGGYDLSVFQKLYSLEHLDLSRHDLKTLGLELKDLYSLRKLNLSLNAISSVDVNSFTTLKQLEILSLSDNQLSTLVVGTFKTLNKLTHLYLNKNRLQQLSPGIFSGLEKLFLLDLSHNDLLRTKPHLVLGVSMPKLTYLYIQGNGLGNEYAKGDDVVRRNEFAMISNHNKLKFMDVNNNGWRCSTLVDVLNSLSNRNVSYDPTNPEYTSTNINGVSCT